MKTLKTIKKEIPFWIIVSAPVIYMLFIGSELPEKIPLHWNLKGVADNYGSKWIMPVLNLVIYILMLVIPYIDPKKTNYKKFENTYYIFRIILVSFFSALQFIIVLNAKGIIINIERFVVTGLFILFISLGNYLGNVKRNWFLGIRTPWTITDETVWRKTHFLTSRIWFWFGLLGLVISFFLTGKVLFIFFILLTSVITLAPIVYSYLLYNKIHKEE